MLQELNARGEGSAAEGEEGATPAEERAVGESSGRTVRGRVGMRAEDRVRPPATTTAPSWE